ncbi:NAD(P)-binding protein [Pseudovirgaria hyperparasitica]|uniref:NAD(P)-binding protein n=1 Tax=Pseudovirgaria hyperparasitica TaxID=470096 RepID=A0A6A6WLH8_9PEZI|nr:NAD(P)-binding protein [Pseudovirgaria hyperparasitica]KAF2762859.1 NAD(P)-binding protein [Pseudovirgaria hyperparasitica]
MADIPLTPSLLSSLAGQTAFITGAASGIGLATALLLLQHGAKVALADLPGTRIEATSALQALDKAQLDRAFLVECDITDWKSVSGAFAKAKHWAGKIDVVVANAGVMETEPFWDFASIEEDDEQREAECREPVEAYRVVDVNLKGTMNTIRLAMFHMRSNPPSAYDGSRGSVVMTASTSGYFGGTGVVSYIASKHGIIGLLRSSQPAAAKYGIRLNAVVPFVTPTHITGSYIDAWNRAELPANDVEDVAAAIAQTACDARMKGAACMIAGKRMRELETFYTALVPQWLGPETTELLQQATKFFEKQGGYPLPAKR